MECGVELRRQEAREEKWKVKCFKCREKGHKCRKCSLRVKKERPVYPEKRKAQEKERRLRRAEEEEAACMARPREAQQREWKRSSWETLKKRAEWYCGPTVPQNAELWELGWRGQGAIVTYLKCPRCGKGGYYVEDDQGQEVVPYWKREKMSWCGCKGGKEQSGTRARDSRSIAREEKAAWPRKAKVQQSGAQSGEPESAAREGDSQREVRRTFKILREVWLDIGIEKVDTHEGVTVKALLDSGATGMFMNREMAKRHGFKMIKLERPLKVKNVDRTENSGGNIMHQVECNVFYKGHVERMRMDVCNLGKTEVILGMPWLQAHNPEIN